MDEQIDEWMNNLSTEEIKAALKYCIKEIVDLEEINIYSQLDNLLLNIKKMADKPSFDPLENITAREFVNALSKKINKYEKEHSHVNIKTCDVNDVWNWIEKIEKKFKKSKNNSTCSKLDHNSDIMMSGKCSKCGET